MRSCSSTRSCCTVVSDLRSSTLRSCSPTRSSGTAASDRVMLLFLFDVSIVVCFFLRAADIVKIASATSLDHQLLHRLSLLVGGSAALCALLFVGGSAALCWRQCRSLCIFACWRQCRSLFAAVPLPNCVDQLNFSFLAQQFIFTAFPIALSPLAMDRPAKRPRLGASPANAGLQSLLHTGGVSISGLAKLLSHPGLAVASESKLRTLNLAVFNDVHKVLKVPTASGEFSWEILDINKLLPALLRQSPALRSLYTSAMDRSPVSADRPWSAIVAFDEFVPGNKLQV